MNRLIYDRTEADVEYAQNNQSNESFLKGAYNYIDLNRIEQWCEYLATELNTVGYSINISTKTNWNMQDFPTQTELERIRSNVQKIKTGFYSISNVPPNMNYMTFKKANEIEKVLYEIYILMHGMANWYVYGGVANGGQPRLWQHRFREFHELVELNVTWNYLSDYYKDVWNEFNNSDTWESVT